MNEEAKEDASYMVRWCLWNICVGHWYQHVLYKNTHIFFHRFLLLFQSCQILKLLKQRFYKFKHTS